ncbi:cell division protein ZapE [Legionella brunensis]|uniref:ATPase N2B (Nucleotide (GTP) binding protein) n=1 Tax=Legionella brunensis TaxID=29422 RepID=A0A0W0S069_9GAMM|nr:cell division protein ZapE [Legionella brunensis]KTC76835.1 ATPase N2B (nucleotide (GTP) binding protein) [Legionella brunensis]
MRLIQCYEEAIARGDIEDDPLQRKVLASMQRLAEDLQLPRRSWLNWLQKLPQPVGLYLYGPVGVGKTYLMDLFYQYVAEEQKVRIHFHHFMQQVDGQLRRLQGQKDPLKRIAAELAKTIRLLCFDEFLVHDVAHAMILAEMLQALFAEGIVLVATSNTPPDELYLNGIQRVRFLPAIALIKTHCEVISLGEKRDYRLGREPLCTAYLYPLNLTTENSLAEQFAAIGGEIEEGGSLAVQNRSIPFVKCSERAVWFEFNVICNLPRSQLDYLEIATRFDTVFVSNIPALTASDTVHVILLIHFIDVMYDRGIRVVMSAAVPLEALYVQGEMSQAFKRTLSRLQEMQSIDYLRRHPRRVAQNIM